jgi:lambda family phage portal protein
LDSRQAKKIKKELIGGRGETFLRKIAPSWAAKRMKSRVAMAATTAYLSSDRSRSGIAGWLPATGDADTDINPELKELRKQSRDLTRTSSLGRAIVTTKTTSVVGYGLTPYPQINRKVLNLSDDQANEYESIYKAEYDLWAGTEACDIRREMNFNQIQSLVFGNMLSSGDLFISTPTTERPETPYTLRLQLIEADRVCNADNVPDTEFLSAGILRNKNGEPVEAHVMRGHPGNYNTEQLVWDKIRFHGADGRRNLIHLYTKERIGQRRGVPILAPVIENIKNLARYTEAEIMAAVVTSFFSVFVKSLSGEGLDPLASVGGKKGDKNLKMGYGTVIDLSPEDEEVTFADPNRPNKNYGDFEAAIWRQTGAALGIPYEILAKVFLKSYSASRASMLEAWRLFMTDRSWFVSDFCQQVRKLWFYEAVALGRIPAPGYLTGDPLVRRAYEAAKWVGPPRGMIDELKEMEASERKTEAGYSTIEEEAALLTGNDAEKVHAQRVKEVNRRREDGLEISLEQIQEFRR